MNQRYRLALACFVLALAGSALPAAARSTGGLIGADKEIDYVEEEKADWLEAETPLPPPPVAASLQPIYVSAAASNQYLIDMGSLSVGSDGVVRYVLVVRTAGGAQNVSFEGIRCAEDTWKMYATGAADGQWQKARISEWRPIENKPVNRHHAALSRDYFCPGGIGIYTADEGRNALRLGKHPNSL